jgi:hypothetical protein
MPVLTNDAIRFLASVVTQMDRITYLDMLTLADRIRRQRHASRLGSRHLMRAWSRMAVAR